MIEIGFAIILGFAITSTLCGFIADHSRADRILMRALAYIAALSCLLGLARGETEGLFSHVLSLTLQSFMLHYLWLALGGALALCAQLVAEGYVHALWVKLHPKSAPTSEVSFGQRAKPIKRSKTVAATLMGTSTEFLNQGLDLREDTLIRLCFYTFEDRGAFALSGIESSLRLGTGRRQKAFHTLAANLGSRPKPQPILHRYSRSINGSSRLCKTLFEDLCRLARETKNHDAATIGRLKQIGASLGLPADMTTKLIGSS